MPATGLVFGEPDDRLQQASTMQLWLSPAILGGAAIREPLKGFVGHD
jgi:hypothetical protein